MLFNRRPRVFFDPNDTPAATPVPAATPPPADSPWASDLATYFGDNAEAIAAADRYQREKIQPYITQLESGSAEARELWTDLNADPASTLRDLFTSVYSGDPEAAARYDALFTEPATPPVETPATPPTAAEVAAMSDEDRELLEWARTKRDAEQVDNQAAAYKTFKDGLKESHGLDDEDVSLLDPFIYSSPDNPDAAVAAYKAWRAKGRPEGETPAVPAPTPPPVLGDASAAATPPLATQYTKYDQVGDALKGFFAREAASSTPPPVVG